MKSKNLVINFILSFSLLLVFCGIPTKSLSQGNASESLKLARTYMIEGHYNEALLAINRSLTVEVSTEALSIKGNILQMLKRDEEAISVFNTAIERGDFKPSTYTLLGTSLQNQRQYYDAIYNYSKAIELQNSKYAYYNRGECKFKIGDKAGGCSDFIEADINGYQSAWMMNEDQCVSHLNSKDLRYILNYEKLKLVKWVTKNKASQTSSTGGLAAKRLFIDKLLKNVTVDQLKDEEARTLYNFINTELMASICIDYAIEFTENGAVQAAISYGKAAISYLRNGEAESQKVGSVFSWMGIVLLESKNTIAACPYFEKAIKEGYEVDKGLYLQYCKN